MVRAATVTRAAKETATKETAIVKEQKSTLIEISQIRTETLQVPIIGTAPLIMHRFSEKAKRQMLDAMQGCKSPKENKDPQAEYEAAMYLHDDGGYGFPVIAFKAATVSGARYYGSSVSMTGMRQFIFFKDDMSKHSGQMLAHITGEPYMREDVVHVGKGGTDLRYRPVFAEWSTTLHVTYVPTMLTRFSLISLIEAGGLGVGVGEWRPERNGDFGTYQIDTTREVTVEGSK